MNKGVCVEIYPLVGKRMTLNDARIIGAMIRRNGNGCKFFPDMKSAIEWAERTQQKSFSRNYEAVLAEDNTYYFIRQTLIVTSDR